MSTKLKSRRHRNYSIIYHTWKQMHKFFLRMAGQDKKVQPIVHIHINNLNMNVSGELNANSVDTMIKDQNNLFSQVNNK